MGKIQKKALIYTTIRLSCHRPSRMCSLTRMCSQHNVFSPECVCMKAFMIVIDRFHPHLFSVFRVSLPLPNLSFRVSLAPPPLVCFCFR